MEWLLPIVTVGAAALLGYANGGNDISKTIATLVGSGEASFRKAVTVGAIASGLGAYTAAFLATRMVAAFSHGLLNAPPTPLFALAVTVGAVVWVLLATRVGWPVSTTHAITGAIVVAGIVAFGANQVSWRALGKGVLLPLLLSPVVSLAIAVGLIGAVRVVFRSCRGGACSTCHWLSAMAASFARTLNDIPKIVALLFTFQVAGGFTHGVVAAGAGGTPPLWMFLMIGTSCALGAIVAGLRVTQTLAYKVTDLNHEEGLTANLATAAVVIATAIRGFPVSTTHVSSFAVIGTGLTEGKRSVHWHTVGEMAFAWAITLPIAGIIGAGMYLMLHYV
jgi:PiT family inorganic phosphate transporter